MAQVQVLDVHRVNNTDDLFVHGTVNGVDLTAHGWVSAVVGMTPAQRFTYCATLLRDAWRATQAPPVTDLGVSGAATLPD
jgi:uncharacterized protein (DUF2237 family)